MTTDPFDRDAGRLQAAIARWLADREVSDPAAGASELVLMARGHGWRPVPAMQPPPEHPPANGLPAEYLERKAALTARINSDGETDGS